MPEDPTTDQENETETPVVVHDDIMKRLLDYQRQLREGIEETEGMEQATSAVSVATETTELLDLSSMESDLEENRASETASPQPQPEPEPEPEPEPKAPEGAEEHSTPSLTLVTDSDAEALTVIGPERFAASAMTSEMDLGGRVERLERVLDDLGSRLGGIRQSFQDMAVAADERLAAIEAEIARARSEGSDPS